MNKDKITHKDIIFITATLLSPLIYKLIDIIFLNSLKQEDIMLQRIENIKSLSIIILICISLVLIILKRHVFFTLLKKIIKYFTDFILYIKQSIYLFIIIALTCILCYYSLRMHDLVFTSILVLFSIVLVILSFLHFSHRTSKPSIFQYINFDKGLNQWEYDGNWTIIKNNYPKILQVTNSEKGGLFYTPKRLINYKLEFETKIVERNSSWLIHGKNLSSYIMFQCESDRINPHYRINGKWSDTSWIKNNSEKHLFPLPINEWFYVSVEVKSSQIVVNIKFHNNSLKYEYNYLMATFNELGLKSGSFGFRESGPECAQFKNIKITNKI